MAKAVESIRILLPFKVLSTSYNHILVHICGLGKGFVQIQRLALIALIIVIDPRTLPLSIKSPPPFYNAHLYA